MKAILFCAVLLCMPAHLYAAVRWFEGHPFEAEVLIDGAAACPPRPTGDRLNVREGQEYSIRIRNPLPVRVGAAVTVDGLNVIDGERSSPAAGRKWIINPYATILIRGWQTGFSGLRRFIFTREEEAYATWKGARDRRDYSREMGRIRVAFFWDRAELAAALEPYPPYALEREPSAGGFKADGYAPHRLDRGRAGTGMGHPQSNPVREAAFTFNEGMYRAHDAVTITYRLAAPCRWCGWCGEPDYYRKHGSFAPEMP